jgi:hypothetical protein
MGPIGGVGGGRTGRDSTFCFDILGGPALVSRAEMPMYSNSIQMKLQLHDQPRPLFFLSRALSSPASVQLGHLLRPHNLTWQV